MGAPVKYTCPDIDKCIGDFKDMEYLANDLTKLVEKYTSKYSSPLEELRESNASLREWGEGLEEDLKVADDELANLKEEIESLTKEKDAQIDELLEKIARLESPELLEAVNNG